MTAVVAVDQRIDAAQALLDQFCAADPGRSVALSFCAHKGPRYKKITIDHSGTALRPVASVIKVALVMALYDLAHTGLIDLDEQVPLLALGRTCYCTIMAAFDEERRLSLRELAGLALITSDNPVAVLLEERVGYQAVAAVLARAGIAAGRQMSVGFREDELGPKNRANQMSALDVIKLFELLRSERRYGPVVLMAENNLRNARIPALLPDEAAIAHKTGSLDGVVNDAGIVRLGVESFVVAFLTDDQADPIATTNDIAACSKGLYDVILGD